MQFLTLNSAWQIDQFYRRRCGIHPSAVANVIAEADDQVRSHVDRTTSHERFNPLRIAVWHHSVVGRDSIEDLQFLSHLQKNRVEMCLTGDVHEMRREAIRTWQEGGMHVIGAGTFGAGAAARPESTPRLYNLLELTSSHIRVHTRSQPQADGAWEGWHKWPSPDGGAGQVAFFDLPRREV